MFEYYVLNYSNSKKKVVPFNVFNNMLVEKETLKLVKEYIKNPGKYVYEKGANEAYIGFDAFVERLNSIIKWQEWGRREYEIFAGDAFDENISNYNKIDCYSQCRPNMRMIAREVLLQYQNRSKHD